MQRALGRKLIAPSRTRNDFLHYLGLKLPPLDPPASVSSWIKTSARVRGEVLRSYLRGHPKELLQWVMNQPSESFFAKGNGRIFGNKPLNMTHIFQALGISSFNKYPRRRGCDGRYLCVCQV